MLNNDKSCGSKVFGIFWLSFQPCVSKSTALRTSISSSCTGGLSCGWNKGISGCRSVADMEAYCPWFVDLCEVNLI